MRDELIQSREAEEAQERLAQLLDPRLPVEVRLSRCIHKYQADRAEFAKDIQTRPEIEQSRLLHSHEQHLVTEILTIIDSERKSAARQAA